MAGHSKWANIKHRKGSQDAKKSKIFTRLIKEITVATRLNGDDVESNPRLRRAIANAKSNNLPLEKISRAVNKGSGNLDEVYYEDMVYEGYGPGGVAILIEVITDNKNRTVSELRHIFSKQSGNLAENGSVSWIFEKKGEVKVVRKNESEDLIFDLALEVGAEDVLIQEDYFLVITKPSDLMEISDLIKNKDYSIKSSEFHMIPKTIQDVDQKEYEGLKKLLNLLDQNDDVNRVFSNLNGTNHP
tara:strand:- start:280 stop:1011 length:732 start_codon:yes stop_codon:yes gene_type:complete